MGIDPDSSSANIITSDDGLYGGGKYLIRQGIGGKGFGLDLGVVTKEINGWTFGASMINVFGTIEWNKPSGMKDFLESYLKTLKHIILKSTLKIIRSKR